MFRSVSRVFARLSSKSFRRLSSRWTSPTAAAARVASFGPSVWNEFTPLALQHKAVNLGQGFPDFTPTNGLPEFLLNAAVAAINNNLVQYTRAGGHPRLTSALGKFYSPLFKRELDPVSNIQVTVGATEALYAIFQGLLNPGDEVLLIEPTYDTYGPDIIMAGGKPVYLALQPSASGTDSGSASQWKLDQAALEAAVTPRTRAIVVNTPQNVPGKVYTRAELEGIASIARKHDLFVVSDEVYESMTYDEAEHIRMATLPGMFDRTLTIGSAGKSFSVTGFKVGWVLGPKPLVGAVHAVHVNAAFCHATPLQEAVAIAFEEAPKRGYFPELRRMFQHKRDLLVQSLRAAGLSPVVPQGSYFVLADISQVPQHLYVRPEYQDGSGMTETNLLDYQFCRWLIKHVGVAAIPPSAFYSKEHKSRAQNYARFCFCKTDEVLIEGGRRLLYWHKNLKQG